MLLINPTMEERLLDVALNLGKRMEAGLDLLWLRPQEASHPHTMTDFSRKAALQGVSTTLIQSHGEDLWDNIKGYLLLHRPPLAAVMTRPEGNEPMMREEAMTKKTQCPVILVSGKPQEQSMPPTPASHHTAPNKTARIPHV